MIIDPKKIPWKKIARGVYIKDIIEDKKKKQKLTLFKFGKNTKLTPHKHADVEWMYVLDGVYQDDFFSVPKGLLKINKKGSTHTSQSSNGCLLLVLWSGKHVPVRASEHNT